MSEKFSLIEIKGSEKCNMQTLTNNHNNNNNNLLFGFLVSICCFCFVFILVGCFSGSKDVIDDYFDFGSI